MIGTVIATTMSPRRKSIDSSESSSSESESSQRDKRKGATQNGAHPAAQSHQPYHQQYSPTMSTPPFPLPEKFDHNSRAPPPHGSPPAYAAQQPPPSGIRIPLDTASSFFPSNDQLGPQVSYDADGVSPVFLGSAIMSNSVHPCKIGPHLSPAAHVPYGGAEYLHHGRYDLLPFVPQQMEWVHTSHGRIPAGRRPIEGGYEEHGGKLYHALGTVAGLKVPGKTGEHLYVTLHFGILLNADSFFVLCRDGANLSFGGKEHVVHDNYEILCVDCLLIIYCSVTK